ncbi:hypothetical protein [Streptomyces sp. Isolate_219]|nr:hypothetical protein [Streptomyces sp. Isolate_219]
MELAERPADGLSADPAAQALVAGIRQALRATAGRSALDESEARA